jgi:hypothetical protein
MFRSINEPIRIEPNFEERWGTTELGLLTSWERGREKRLESPELAAQASLGQLVVLPWKGGVEKALQKQAKFGVFNYLAMWQGLRGEDLNIDPSTEMTLTCTVTSMTVTFTDDMSKFAV